MEVVKIEAINPLISKVQIKVCYVGDEPNRNKSIITKDVARELAQTLPGCPIVGYYNENTEDFEEHNRVIDISNGRFRVVDTTRPYGFVPTNARVWFEWYEDDGVAHEYLVTEGYIWTGQYPESQRVVDEGNNQSMELDNDSLNAYWTKDGNGKPQFFIINEAIMSKLCILGEEAEPCFEGANITAVQFSFEDGFKEKLFSLVKEMQEILSNEGGTPVFNTYAVEIGESLWSAIYEYIWKLGHDDDYCPLYSIDGIFEEGTQKFAILRDRKNLTYHRLNFSIDEANGFVPAEELEAVAPEYKPLENPQFALEAVEAYETQFSAEKKAEEEEEKQPEEEPASEVVEPEKVEEKATPEVVEEGEKDDDEPKDKYNLEEVVEYAELKTEHENLQHSYEELQTKFAELTETVNQLNAQIEQLTNDNKILSDYKLEREREKKQALITDTFYMLSDEQKKDCIDNIDTYSYDEIEAKLSVICVRNKVSFDLDKPEEEKKPITYNIDHVEDDIDNSLPAWIQRVKEVAKENNI